MPPQASSPPGVLRAFAATLTALAACSVAVTARADGGVAPTTAPGVDPSFAPAPAPASVPAPSASYAPLAPYAPVASAPYAAMRSDYAGTTSEDYRIPPHTDPALPVGIVDGAIGLALVGFGFALEDGEATGGFVGAGLGSIAAGIPMFASGVGSIDYARNSEGAFTTGAVLVSVASTIAGGGIGGAVGDHLANKAWEREFGASRSPQYFGALAFSAAIGTLVAGVGSGLMIYGAIERSDEQKAIDADERAARRLVGAQARSRGGEVSVPRSVPRRTAGQVLVIIGAASGIAATAVGVHIGSESGGDFAGFAHLFTTIPLAVNGVICTTIGIPLWVTGAAEVPIDEVAKDQTWMPAVSLGAGQATVSMKF